MDESYDINTIDAHDFNTPRKDNKVSKTRKSVNNFRRVGSNFEMPYKSQEHKSNSKNYQSLVNDYPQKDVKSITFNVSPFQFYQKYHTRQSSHDFGTKIRDLSTSDAISSQNSTNQHLQIQPLKQFSFSKDNLEQFKSNELEPQQEKQNEGQSSIQKKSPLGIPFQPFHHTRSGFKSKNNLEEGTGGTPKNQVLSSYLDSSQFLEQRSDSQLGQFGQLRNKSCFVQREENSGLLNKYDQKIFDINQTLKQMQLYKNNLDSMQKQSKKRSKSQNMQSTKSDNKFKLPAIKQPVMYFSPIEQQQSPKSQKKMKKAKKQKQQGMVSLAKQILNNMPQEKLANLMAINMYNQALMKKEINQEKITTVIEEQNKLLSKMLEQYDKKHTETKKQIKVNLSKVEDGYERSKFEKDKKNFEKVYSNIQKEFDRSVNQIPFQPQIDNNENYLGKPLLTDSDLPDQIRNTKHLKRIHTHSQKYKQFIPSKISQPPMQF